MNNNNNQHTLIYNFSLRKDEILRGEKNIQLLFKSKNSFFSFPFKVLYTALEESVAQNKILISVPKRNFKRAVDRNKIKRQIKEAYRTQKSKFVSQNNKTYFFTLLYLHTKIILYSELEKKVNLALVKLYQINK